MKLLAVFLLFFSNIIFCHSEDYDIEILPDTCDCRDWYGSCRVNGENWLDDDVWKYTCSENRLKFAGCHVANGDDVAPNENSTQNGGFWAACGEDEQKLRFEVEPFCEKNSKNEKVRVGQEYRDGSFQWLCLETGKWITGCYYFNETHTDLLLPVGQKAYNGLIEHVCDKRQEYPAIVQYYSQVRKDVDVKHPTNKGINRNFPEPLRKLIRDDENIRWLHSSAKFFVKNEEKPRSYTRFLPASRKPLG